MNQRCLLFVALALGAAGCHNRVEEELYSTCSTAGVTYGGSVVAILNGNQCLSCHTGSQPSGNVALGQYAEVKTVVDNGRLYGAISHSPGYHPMPHGGGKIADCDIKKIKAWIDAGAPNN